jgi:hypothetical protein
MEFVFCQGTRGGGSVLNVCCYAPRDLVKTRQKLAISFLACFSRECKLVPGC